MENKRFWNRASRVGTYTVVMTAIVLAVLIIANVFVLSAPSKYTRLDMTSLELYTLSDVTEEALPKIKDGIKIYFICQGGTDNSGNAMDNIPHLTTFLSKYEDLCPNLELEIVDPVVNPTFYTKYSETELENYTLIIESEKRFKIVDFYDLYFYSVEGYGNMSYSEYSQIESYYNMYYGQSLGGILNFDGESVITNALDYVTTDKIPQIYYLSDHGVAPSASLISQIENENMMISALSLRTAALPEDAEVIYLNQPKSDINEDEAAILSEFLAGGGRLTVTTAYTATELPNLMGILADYGMAPQQGLIIETAAGMYYQGMPYGLMPSSSADSKITSSLSSVAFFAPLSHGIIISEELPEGVNVTELFTTSAKAYTIAADAQTTEETDDSVHGQFTLSAIAEKENGGTVIWTAADVFTDNCNSIVSGGNYKYFLSMLNYLCPREQTVRTIPSTALENSMLIVEESQATLWGTLLTAIVPIIILGACIVRWYLRRRR